MDLASDPGQACREPSSDSLPPTPGTGPLTDMASPGSPARQVDVCPDPVFIIGAPRSGTTILATALGQHHGLWYSDETNFLPATFKSTDSMYQRGTYWFRREHVTLSEFRRYLGLGINALLTARSSGRRWIEKTPHNSFALDSLGEAFPTARFVHIVRDGRHVVTSMVNSPFIRYWVHSWAVDFRRACATWSAHVREEMRFTEQNAHRCLTIHYAQLCASPEDVFSTVFRFLDLPFDPAPIDYFRSHRLKSSFEGRPAGDPIRRRPRDPWAEWTIEHKQIFLAEAGLAMLSLGLISEDELEALVEDASRESDSPASARWDDWNAYRRSVRSMAAVVQAHVPEGAPFLVISRGDEVICDLAGRRGWHFPQTESGVFAGEYPATDRDAIAHLEALRARGASFLLIPAPAFWWLEYYEGFQAHLDAHYRRVVDDEACILFSLGMMRGGSKVTGRSGFDVG